MHTEACAGSRVNSLTVSAADILNVKHSTSCSLILFNTIGIEIH